MAFLADPTRFRRTSTGLSFLAAGVFVLAGLAATRWDDGSGTAAYLDSLAANPVQAQVAALLLHFGFAFFVPAVLGALGVLTRRGVVLGHLAAIFIVIGGSTLPGLLVTDFYGLSLAENLPRESAVAVEEGVGDYPAVLILAIPAVIGTQVAVLLAVVALWRARVVSIAAPVLTLAGSAINFFAPPGLVTAVLGGGVLALGLGVAGIALFRLSDAEWEAGGPDPRAETSAPGPAATPR